MWNILHLPIDAMLYFFLIGTDRLYSIVKPIRYRTRVTKRGLKIRVIAVWAASLVGSIAYVLYYGNIIPQFIYYSLAMLGAFIFLGTVGLFPSTYILTRKALSKRQQMVFPTDDRASNHTGDSLQQNIESRREFRLMKMFCIMFSVYMAAFTLLIPYIIIIAYTDQEAGLIITMLLMTMKFSSIFNPLVVFVMKKDFRYNICFTRPN